jgi:hypothetical protein
MSGAALGLADVTGRARSIRRRRTASVVVGAAAAVALLVPTVALASHTGGKPEPAPAVTDTPSPSPTQSATEDGHQPEPGVLDVSHLPTGASPRIAYAEGSTVHRANDGYLVDVGHPIEELATLADASIVYGSTDSSGDLVIRVWSNTAVAYPAVHGLAVNADRTMVGFASPAGNVLVWQSPFYAPSPGTRQQAIDLGTIPGGSDFSVSSVMGDDCMQMRPTSACAVDVNATDSSGDRQPWEVTPDGTTRVTDGSYLTVADQSESGLTIGLDSVSDSGSCSKLLGGGEFQGFSTCKNTLVSFSPDGKFVLADPAYHDGIGNGVIAMYDLEGHRLFQRTNSQQAQSFYQSAQWEDDTHVLVSVYQNGHWSIVRIASDGSMEYAVPPVAGDMDHSPFVLETRP